jgi:hypothetical protein
MVRNSADARSTSTRLGPRPSAAVVVADSAEAAIEATAETANAAVNAHAGKRQ